MKKCSFCSRRTRSQVFHTTIDSPNHGTWYGEVIPNGHNDGPDYIELLGDNRTYTLDNISFCPICGRCLDKTLIKTF